YTFVHINTTTTEDLITEEELSMSVTQNELDGIEEAFDTGEIEEDDRETVERKEYLEEVMIEKEILLQNYKDENWVAILQSEIDGSETFIESRIFRNESYVGEWPSLFTQQSLLK